MADIGRGRLGRGQGWSRTIVRRPFTAPLQRCGLQVGEEGIKLQDAEGTDVRRQGRIEAGLVWRGVGIGEVTTIAMGMQLKVRMGLDMFPLARPHSVALQFAASSAIKDILGCCEH